MIWANSVMCYWEGMKTVIWADIQCVIVEVWRLSYRLIFYYVIREVCDMG